MDATLRAMPETGEREGAIESCPGGQARDMHIVPDLLLEKMQIGITVTDLQGKIVYTNPAEARMHGYAREELISKDAHCLAPPQYWNATKLEHMGELTQWKRESVNVRKDGTIFPVELLSEVLRNPSGEVLGLLTTCEDLTERKKVEQELARKALYDSLTGLANRTLFMDRLGQACKRTRGRHFYLFAILFLDLDCFKSVNDSHGHLAGDEVLVQVARRLISLVRAEDTVARIGGDEFTILLDGIKSISESIRVAERIRMELSIPIWIHDLQIKITASTGIVVNDRNSTPEDLLYEADTAMYRAKSRGRDCYEVFEDVEEPETDHVRLRWQLPDLPKPGGEQDVIVEADTGHANELELDPDLIRRALELAKGDRTKAAKMLSLSTADFYYWAKKHKLE